MAMPRAPVDPYCRTNGAPSLVRADDADPNLSTLAKYATALKTRVWRYPDGKLALVSERFQRQLVAGREREPVPLVFGAEGETLADTAAAALGALKDRATSIREAMRATVTIERQARRRRLDPVEPPADPIRLVDAGEIGQAADVFLRGLPTIDEVTRDITGHRAFGPNGLLPVATELSSLGKAGVALRTLFRRRDELVSRVRAIAMNRLREVLDELTPDEIATGYAAYVEKGVLANEARRETLERAYGRINEIDNWFYDTMRALGLDVKPKVGAGPLNPTGRYFPHKRDLAALGDRGLAESMIQEVQDRAMQEGRVQLTRDQALDLINKRGWGMIGRDRAIASLKESAARHGSTLSTKDAERLLDSILRDKAERLSSNVERSRKLDFDGYITDVRRAYTATWTRNAYRVADVAILGRHDERVHRLLAQLNADPALGPRAVDYARRVYDLEIGRKRVEFGDIARELYALEGAKLSLSVLANMTQSLNAVMRVGMRPFLAAMREAIREPTKFANLRGGTLAEQTGALPTRLYGSDATMRLVADISTHIREQGMEAMLGDPRAALGPIGRALTKPVDWIVGGSLAAFRYVENFNRSISQRAGEIYFEQLAEQLARRGEAGLAHAKIGARLLELDLSSQAVLAAARRGDAQALSEMRTLAGLRISDETQFKSNYQSMPLWANESEPMKFVFQFKNFTIGQTRFMLRELDPRRARRDPERYIRALATIGLAYPAVGIALTSVRQNMMGPTLAGDKLAELLDDPTVLNVILAGGVAMSMAGALGIVADIGMTAALGNSYALRSFAIPPIASSAINAVEAFGGAARAAANADPQELRVTRAALLRQFGGFGAVVEEKLRQAEGRSEESLDPIEAIFGASPF